MTLSLRDKLILVICLPLLAVYLTVLAIDYRRSKALALAAMERHLTELTGRLATEIDRDLSTAAQAARSTAAFVTRRQPDRREQVEALLESVLGTNQTVCGSGVAYEPGAFTAGRERFAPYVCREQPGAGLKKLDINYDYPRWDWYLLPKLLDRPVWTDPYFDEGAGDALMCTYAAPFYRQGKFQGVVGVDIALVEMQPRLASVDTRGGYCALVSQTGTFVSHPDPSYIMAESVFSLAEWHESAELAEIGREMTAGETGVRRFRDVDSGRPAWIVFVPVPSVQWSLAAVIPEDQVMAEVHGHVNRQAGLLLGGMAAIIAIIVVASSWVTRPVGRLAAAASEVARGNLDVRVAGGGRDEIGSFIATFNRMVKDLKENVEMRVRETAVRESMERELQIARQIQASLLPRARPPFPSRREFSLDARTEAAKIMAGDFFDFWFVEDDVLVLVMADVSGKGVPAAMFMAVARTALRSFSVPGRSPAEVLAAANRVLAADNDEMMFVTVFYIHYHVRTGELVLANAGHNPPFLTRRDGTILMLEEPTGIMLGVNPEAEYDERRQTLGPGDTLVLYTDGVTEARNDEGVLLGEDGLRRILEEARVQSVEEICGLVLQRVDAYRSSPDQDDVTVLALRREAPAEAP